MDAQVDEVAVFAAARKLLSKNVNCSIEESLERFQGIFKKAKQKNTRKGYVSCVVECPYEGKVSPENVLRVASNL
ncbi:MAG: hypothetical protein CM15mP98_05380 [Paracoccaceae bacterium]|nr:MAG: hypothetical protein CM15mP98_05380 [Paracoccaceae bacterium]